MVVHTAQVAAPVIKTVVENHTVIVNNLHHVLNQLILLIPTGAALSALHWVLERDKLSAGQNRLIAVAYSLVAAVVLLVLNHTINLNNLLNSTDLEALSLAFVAVAGAAQHTYNLLTVFHAAKSSNPATTSVPTSEEAVTAP